MAKNLGTLIMYRSKTGEYLNIFNDEGELLGKNTGTLTIARKDILKLLKKEEDRAVVSVFKKDEE
jgi:hypothetical protein